MAQHEENLHFFRVILPHHIIQNGTLELPRNFVKEHGQHLSTHARLKVRTGSESEMELKRSNGRAWLDKGWRDFVDKYSIKGGYFLVFKYEGGSRFSVLIFGLSTWEIEYPVSPARTSNKKERECEVIEIKEDDSEDDECAVVANKSEMDRVLQRPGSFMIDLHDSILSFSQGQRVHFYCCRRYFKGEENGENMIILHGSNGKTWPVKYRLSETSAIRMKAEFTHGWKEFASDNHLRVGDICIFEMISKAKAYKVTISRVAQCA